MEAVAWEVINTRRFAASFGKLIRAPDPDGNLAPVVDDGPKLSAINTLVKIAERRAKFRGLDAPQRRAVDVITGDMVESLIADLERQADALLPDPGEAMPQPS